MKQLTVLLSVLVGLLAPVQIGRQLPAQHRADGGGVPLPQLLLHVHHQHLGQGAPVEAVLQGEQAVPALPGLVHGLHGRGGRAQHQQGVMLDAAVFCYIPGVVAGDVF